MKDKLRELAGECRKPYPEGAHGTRYADGYNDAGNDIADRLVSIIDAEGDGGAVPVGYADPLSMQGYTLGQYGDFCVGDKSPVRSVPLYDRPHPARSGVVSDEDVEGAWMVLTGRAGSIAHEKDHECMMDIERKAVRAALEHFAAIAQEKQS